MSTLYDDRITKLEQENADLRRELAKSLEYQTATSDVLKAISRSTFDLQPVLDTLIETAAVLCGANAATGIAIRQGDVYRHVAMFSHDPEWVARVKGTTFVPDRSTIGGRVALEGQVVHVTDLAADPEYNMPEAVTIGGMRTLLGVPLLREGEPIGVLLAGRENVQPFTGRQIELLRSFADQAVIAIENARLITETREALDQQTATAEVLQVINSSPGDLEPVFDAILDKAHRLCGATRGTLFLFDGQTFRAAAMHGYPPPVEGAPPRAINVSEDPRLASLVAGERLIHIPDLTKIDDPIARAVAERGGVRTNLLLPLRRDGALLGVISCNRDEVRPFSDKDIALLENFAAQAVIAIENARLITETREALDQQTATAEVLGVINSSIGDPAPVFDAILEKAFITCGAAYGTLTIFDGKLFRVVANRGLPASFERLLRQPFSRPAGAPEWRLVGGERYIHLPDIAAPGGAFDPDDPLVREAIEVVGIRTLLFLPLRKDGALLGFITVHRIEVRPFTDKQIALLENFAAQAVIAMENARLITETREALDQQTATAEVLQVINASPGDLAPVFEVMAERAVQLCEADEAAVRTFDGELLHLVTTQGTDPAALERLSGFGPTTLAGLYEPFARGDEVVHYVDARDTDAYRTRQTGRQRIDARGIRSWLAVALRKEGVLLGIINVHRREVRPFSDKEIALLQNFAAQAVIAMENARLLGELRQRTDEVAELNRGLEARVAEQVDELGRVGNLRRFLPPQVAEMVVSRGDERILESHRREIVVVFADVRDYTSFTETAEPEEVIDFLGAYHATLGPLITRFEGTLSHFFGDGLMVFFNDPVPCPDPAERAVKMALAMRGAAGDLVTAWRRRGYRLGFGVGIAQGYATLGQIGFADRSDYTAIGTVTNLAARLCGEAKDSQILISQRIATAVEDSTTLEEIGDIALKGLSQAVAVYNVVQ